MHLGTENPAEDETVRALFGRLTEQEKERFKQAVLDREEVLKQYVTASSEEEVGIKFRKIMLANAKHIRGLLGF